MDPLVLNLSPAFLALTIKVWLLLKSDKRQLLVNNWPLAAFFASIAIFNSIEVLTYSRIAPVSFYDFFIKWYDGAIVLAISFLLVLSIKVADIKIARVQKLIMPFVVFSLAFFILIISTDLFITGYTRVDYGFTRIPGEYNFLIEYFAMTAVILSFSVLVWGSLRENTQSIHTRRCRILLYSFLPFILCIAFLALLMLSGVPVTGAVIIPLTTTYLLLIFVFTETEKQVFNILVHVPYTRERKAFKQINRMVLDFLSETSAGKQVNLKSLSRDIENHIVTSVVNQMSGRQCSAAGLLGISPSTVTRKKSAANPGKKGVQK